MSRCRSCNAEIVWAVTAKGKRIPLDAAPVPGLFRFDAAAETADSLGEPVYRSHFSSCPDAALHRRPR